MFTSIQNLIPQISRKKGMLNVIQGSSMCKTAQDLLNSIFEHQNFQPKAVSFKNSKLKISCKNSSELQEVTMHRSEILKELQTQSLDEKIKEIFFTLDG